MSRHHEIDEQGLKAAAQEIVRRIREEEDPLELTLYRKMFKKAVPLFLRSYVAAYLFRQLYGKGVFTGLNVGTSGPRKKINPTSLFVSIGKNRRVFPRDLVQLLISAGKVTKADIGDIKILDNYAFVEIDEPLASQVIRNLDGLMYRGRRLTVNFAKKKADDSGASPKPMGRGSGRDTKVQKDLDTPYEEELPEEDFESTDDYDDEDLGLDDEDDLDDSSDPEIEQGEKKDPV